MGAQPAIDWDAPTAALEHTDPVELLRNFIGRYYNDRVAFFKECLGVEQLEEWQETELRALDNGAKRLTVRSGHGVGKTMFLSGCILHFMVTRFPSKTAVTAPSAPQLFDGLAAECKMWLKRMEARQPLLKGMFVAMTDRIYMAVAPESCFCTYRTSRKESPEALQGIHSDNVLLIADEASGVDEAVFEAAAGSMSTVGAITILTGNPTRATGFFFKTHTVLRHIWRSVRVSCFESSRVDRNYIEEERAFGEESNRWRIRILGEFPQGDDDTLIARELVESALKRDVTAPRKEPIYWGLDVARSLFRDKSSLAKRKGPVVLGPIKRFQYNDTMRLVGAVKAEYDEAKEQEKPEAIFVDVIGVGGGVLDRLIELNLPAVGVNVGELPSVLSKGVRLRDELWLNLRDWFMTKVVKFPDDPQTIEEIVAPLVQHRSDGREKVESKDEMRGRGALNGKSPDGADAVCLTFARTGAITAGAMQGSTRTKGALRRKSKGRV